VFPFLLVPCRGEATCRVVTKSRRKRRRVIGNLNNKETKTRRYGYNWQPRMNTQRPSAAYAATTDFGLRREAKRHAAFGSNRQHGKRCRRCALPPQSKSLSSVREVAGLYYEFNWWKLAQFASSLSCVSRFISLSTFDFVCPSGFIRG